MSSPCHLHGYYGQVTMQSNFTQTACCDVVQRPLTFEPRKRSFHGLSLLCQSLPLRSVQNFPIPCSHVVLPLWYLNDRNCSVLPFDESEKMLGTVSRVCHEVTRMELPARYPTLLEGIGSSSHIVDIACAYVGSDGEFGFAVHNQVQFVPVNVLGAGCLSNRRRPNQLRLRQAVLRERYFDVYSHTAATKVALLHVSGATPICAPVSG